MLAPLIFAAVIGTPLHFEGDLTPDGGDFATIDIDVPVGTVEIQIDHSDDSSANILDWGLWSPEGYRGWAGGLEDPAVIGVSESSRSYLIGPITAGLGWTVIIGKAKIAQPPAHYVVDVTFRDAPTLAPEPRTAWVPAVLETNLRWYKGDFHVHSRESGDATAEIADIAALARMRGLDFVALSDHNTVSQDDLLAYAQQSLDDLLLVRSIEVTTYGGHGGALGASSYVDHRVGFAARTAAEIIADVTAQGAAFIVNHPALDLGAACIGCAWQHADTPWDQVAAMELHTGDYETTIGIFTPLAVAMWDAQLDAGYHIAGVGGSDDHKAGIDEGMNGSLIGSPTTLVYAESLSEQAIIDAVRAGRTSVQLRGPDDPFVELFVSDGPTGFQAMIGGTVAANRAAVEAHVVGGMGRELDIVRNGEIIDAVTVTTDDWTQTFDYPVSPGGDRFRAELYENSLRLVVTSHIWVTFVPVDLIDDGSSSTCGCRVGARPVAAAAAAALVLLACAFLTVVRRRRRP